MNCESRSQRRWWAGSLSIFALSSTWGGSSAKVSGTSIPDSAKSRPTHARSSSPEATSTTRMRPPSGLPALGGSIRQVSPDSRSSGETGTSTQPFGGRKRYPPMASS